MKTAVVTVSAIVLVAGGSAAAGSPQRPSIGVAGKQPLVVAGKHFKAGERIAVQVMAPEYAGKSVVANSRGSFRAVFRLLSVGPCERVAVHAFGSRGSRARLLPQRELGFCLPSR